MIYEHVEFLLLLPVVYVLTACICRLNLMTPATSKPLWRVMYLMLAAWAGWVAADLATNGDAPVRDAVGILAVALYMHLTRRRWADGVPEVAR